jgi:hypothetical protein
MPLPPEQHGPLLTARSKMQALEHQRRGVRSCAAGKARSDPGIRQFVERGVAVKAKEERELSKSQFGLPNQRKYPMPDKSHAANAKARAKQQLKRGKLTRGAYKKIVAKANGVLGRSKRAGSKRRKRH